MQLEQNIKLPNLRKISLLRNNIENWQQYPFNVSTIKNLTEINISSKVCFFVGENGSGKSTLMEAIAENFGFNKEGGSKNISYKSNSNQANHGANLGSFLRLSWGSKLKSGYFLRSESFFNVATYLDKLQEEDDLSLQSYGGKSLHSQSHGESFLSLFRNRFSKKGFYLLDEPEAALSPQRQLSFLAILHDILSENSEAQFIIATHSPILLAYPNSQVFSFKDSQIEEVNYTETETYQVMRGFLNNPSLYLRHLLQT